MEREKRGDGSEAMEARWWERGDGSDVEEAQMAKSADFLPVLRADCSLEHESG